MLKTFAGTTSLSDLANRDQPMGKSSLLMFPCGVIPAEHTAAPLAAVSWRKLCCGLCMWMCI